MLLEEELAQWLRDRGITAPISYDYLPDAEPHTAVAISISGGLGMTLEQQLDRPTVSVLTRAPNGRAARDLGIQLDRAMLDPDPGFTLEPSGTRVSDKGRFGGPPSFVAIDDRSRVVRNAIYWMEVTR